MVGSELWSDGHEPSENQIKEFVDTPLWDDISGYLLQAYNVRPKLFFSRCSMNKGFWKGWNVKYKKNGKSLCTLYPKQGHFIALVTLGVKEIPEADRLIPLCGEYVRDVYHRTGSGKGGGKSLAIDVTSETILRDVKALVALRLGSR